ncbi:hypothetical protein HWV62_29620 [Athelia sp. TMB]|nr:hypothetical protein HWV62_29620 [Athelia sp. TMB]
MNAHPPYLSAAFEQYGSQANPGPTGFIPCTSGHANVNNIGRDMIIENYHHPHLGRISLYPDFVMPDAAYNGRSARVGCLRGTRVLAIARILTWRDGPDAKLICWMSSPAGFGKSAISQTVAETCARDGTLAASFFFLRGAGGRSKIDHFITTLAFQITISVPGFKPLVERAFQRDPTIVHQSITYQLQNLIFEPFMALAQANIPDRVLLVIVDGLDECNDRDSMRDFITALADACHVSRHLKLRWLLTSRGEEHIRQSFSDPASQRATVLLKLEAFNARNDIKMFLEARFSTIIQHNTQLFRYIPPPWPSLWDMDTLVDKSSGMFVFAATLVKFVTDGQAPPDRKLKSVLQVHAGLDPLYDQVLRDASYIACFRRVLTALMLAYEQPSVEILAEILELGAQDVLHALLAIQSIINIPSDDNEPIELNHTSLRDFLVDESRSGDLFVDPPTAHAVVSVGCLEVLQRNLKTDIFPETAGSRYAAKYWARHLLDSSNASGASHELLGVLHHFSSSQVMETWINMLIHRSDANGVVMHLSDLSPKYEVTSSLVHSGRTLT